jgi:phage-related tail protein
MSEVGANSAQLDRIEKGLSDLRALNTQILDRLTRMEERQNGHAADLERAEARIERLEAKVEKIEQDAVADQARSYYQRNTLFGRWSALKTVGLLLLGAALSITGKVIAKAIQGL